jgi:hypothetical protein
MEFLPTCTTRIAFVCDFPPIARELPYHAPCQLKRTAWAARARRAGPDPDLNVWEIDAAAAHAGMVASEKRALRRAAR